MNEVDCVQDGYVEINVVTYCQLWPIGNDVEERSEFKTAFLAVFPYPPSTHPQRGRKCHALK